MSNMQTLGRWELLKSRERAIVWRYVVLGEKRYTVGQNLGLSLSRVAQHLDNIYRVIGVKDSIELAFFVGRNYEQIEFCMESQESKVVKEAK